LNNKSFKKYTATLYQFSTMARPNPARNMDSRTRLLNSLGHFKPQEQQQQRDVQSIPGPSGANDAEIRSGPGGGGGNSNNDTTSNTSEKIKKLNRHRRYNSDIPVRSALHNTIAFKTKLNDDESTDVPHPLLRTAMKKEKPPRHTRRSSYSPEAKINNNSNDDTASGGGGGGGGVRFNTVVSGVQIPSRNQYSKRIKQQLWRDRHELHEMVERNTTEFHAENYDWTQVVLDDEMYIDSTSGERVHPCHVLGNDSFTDDEDDDDDEFSFTPLTRSDSAITSASPTTTPTPTGRSL
jgi:hypothetical protein